MSALPPAQASDPAAHDTDGATDGATGVADAAAAAAASGATTARRLRASWQARIASRIVRRRLKPLLADMRDPQQVRRAFAGPRPLPAPGGVRVTPATLGGVPGEWVQAEAGAAGAAAPARSAWGRLAWPADSAGAPAADARPTVLLYLHGGGFVGCSPRTHRPLTAALALQGLRVYVPDYRLAPEHPFPAAPDDALAVWRALRAELLAQAGPAGTLPRIVVAGDSAGGNLALGLMLRLRDAGEPLPDAAALFSPSTDLAGESASLVTNAQADAMFSGRDALEPLGRCYLGEADPLQPLASPLRGDLHGLPPLLVHVGEQECLRDDALRLVEKARSAGVTVQCRVFDGVPHVWQLLWRVPEARRSVADAAQFLRQAQDGQTLEQHDVLVIGAGLSGIGAAVHLLREHPDLSIQLLEGRGAIGGTWDLFRYPGVRSDSDMYTLGYDFKPWTAAKAIADGPSIRQYIRDTAEEHGIQRLIRFHHRVLSADWDSASALWTVTVAVGADAPAGTGPAEGQPPPRTLRLRTRWLLNCGGYYRYAQGHRPQWPGEADYRGRIVHPQAWPEDLRWDGQRVVVIGSGATAVTLVPELARTAQVTMLQRSPTYLFSRPAVDPVAEKLKRWLPARLAYRLVRSKNISLSAYFYRLARKYPQQAKARMVGLVQQQLPAGYDVATHFTPRYNPWDQRVCLVPDADFFIALRERRAEVVTDTIERFVPEGIRLASGRVLPADLVVTATGLALNVLADVQLRVDGAPVDLSKAFLYKGMMYSGVPNLATTFGYTNASWTLKADLSARYLCRMLRHLRRHRLDAATPRVDPSLREQPFLDFNSGYVLRALPMLPKQGDRKPWRLYQNYLKDWLMFRFSRVDDGAVGFQAAHPGR